MEIAWAAFRVESKAFCNSSSSFLFLIAASRSSSLLCEDSMNDIVSASGCVLFFVEEGRGR